MAITPTLVDQWSDGKRLLVIGSFVVSGNYVIDGVTIDFGAIGVRSSQPPLWFNAPTFRGYSFEYVPVTGSGDGKLRVYETKNLLPVATLTSDAVIPADGDTVTIGASVYTLKTALTASTTAGQVLIGGSAAQALENLKAAINLGVNSLNQGAGIAYGSLTTINLSATAFTLTATTLFLVSRLGSTAGDTIASTETSTHLSFGGATFVDGVLATNQGSELAAAAFPVDLVAFTLNFYAIFNQYI